MTASTRTQALSHFRRILKEVHLQYTHPKELLGKELSGKGLLGINVHANKVWTDALKDAFRNNAHETDPVKLNKLYTDGEDLAVYLESQRNHKVLTMHRSTDQLPFRGSHNLDLHSNVT